eukprot:jgi/Orpsp1_1/1191002/evm.model.d7180000082817.2
MSLIAQELSNYYNSNEISDLDIQFSDYIIDLYEKKRTNYFEKQIKFYKDMLNCDYHLLNLPKRDNSINININDEENRYKNNNNRIISMKIDTVTCQLVNEYISTNKLSKTAFFITVYGYVLSKYSNQDIIYSSIIGSNRNNYYTDKMIGMFVSTLPILLKYDNNEDTFSEIIKNNMNILLDVYNNQDISFSELSNQLKLTNINNSFIFQPDAFLQNMSKKSLFSDYQYNNNDINNSRTLLCNEQNSIHNNNISKFDLMFGVFEKKDDYILSVEYNNNLYDQKIIDDILDSYIEVLKNVKYFSDK